MKTCPVCGASSFEDMEICFECLHDFTTDSIDALDDDLCPDVSVGELQETEPYKETTPSVHEHTLVVPALTVAQSEQRGVSHTYEVPEIHHKIIIEIRGVAKDTKMNIL